MMAIPTVEEFYVPLLRVLSDQRDPIPAKEAVELAARTVDLSDEERRLKAPGGKKPIYSKRISWAMTHLKRSGHTESPSWGYWQITESGLNAVSAGQLGNTDLAATVDADQDVARTGAKRQNTARLVRGDPDEIIRTAVESSKDVVAGELLSRVRQMDATRFEELVLEVLQQAYGRRPQDVRHTGGQGDGGIDGKLALDPFGLQWAHMQAKRWTGNVGRPEIQQFAGAVGEHRVNHGIFVTSGSYSGDATDFARKSDKNIVLIDGEQLVEAMIEYKIGVTHEIIRRPHIDSDYFEDEA